MTDITEKPLKYVGRSYPVTNAHERASGQTRYVADMPAHNQLYLRLVTSTIAHGRIKAVHIDQAFLPGVVKIYTHKNTPRTRFNSQQWFNLQNSIKDQVVLTDRVRYFGEPVAAVLAEDPKTAQKAAALVFLEYDPLPLVLDPQDALTTKTPLHGTTPVSEVRFSAGKDNQLESAWADAYQVVEDRVVTPKIHHGAMEPHACLAVPGENGCVIVHSPCQLAYAVRLLVARILELPVRKVRVIKTNVGGSFGGKQEVVLEPLAAFCALDTNRPVMVEMDRTQSIVATRTRTKTIGRVRTAVDRQGLILARDIDFIVDAGAYTSNGPAISGAMGKKTFRLYRLPAQQYRARVVHTNTPISGAVRGYGTPQVSTITEINIDHTARRLGMDPVEFRLKNLVHPFDKDPSGGPSLGNARILDCVTRGAEAFEWNQRRKDAQNQTGRWRRGVGMACAVHGNGYFGAYPDLTTMTLRMEEDGSVFVNACLHELGHGVVTIIRQIVAEVMDLDFEQVTASEADTLFTPFDTGCQASRGVFVIGKCAMQGAEALREMLLEKSAQLLKLAPEDLVNGNGRIWSRNNPGQTYSYKELVHGIIAELQTEVITTLTFQAKANPGSYAAYFVDLAVDTLTGQVEVQKVLAVHDVGRAINPGFVRGQIHGGVQMGLGMALFEEVTVDPKTGRSTSDSLSRYHMVNAPDMPLVDVILIEEKEEHGPFGAKSVSELAAGPIVPATVNAVNHSLNSCLTQLPLTPEKILARQ